MTNSALYGFSNCRPSRNTSGRRWVEPLVGNLAPVDWHQIARLGGKEADLAGEAAQLNAIAIIPNPLGRKGFKRNFYRNARHCQCRSGTGEAWFSTAARTEVLPLAAAAAAEIGATGLNAEGTRLQNLEELGLRVAFFGIHDPNSHPISRCGQRHKDYPAIGIARHSGPPSREVRDLQL